MRKLIKVTTIAAVAFAIAGMMAWAITSETAQADTVHVVAVDSITANGQDGGPVTYIKFTHSDDSVCYVNLTGVNRSGRTYC